MNDYHLDFLESSSEAAASSGGIGIGVPVWLLLGLAIMWCVFVWKQPKDDRSAEGWYILPGIISVVAFALTVAVGGTS